MTLKELCRAVGVPVDGQLAGEQAPSWCEVALSAAARRRPAGFSDRLRAVVLHVVVADAATACGGLATHDDAELLDAVRAAMAGPRDAVSDRLAA